MKMEHVVFAEAAGTVSQLLPGCAPGTETGAGAGGNGSSFEGAAVLEGALLVAIRPSPDGDGDGDGALFAAAAEAKGGAEDLSVVRSDVAEVIERHALLTDARRPQAVERRATARHPSGPHRTARANVEDLVDDGSFVEYGSLVVAGQRRRRDMQDLIENTPADGMLAGVGTVNQRLFEADRLALPTPSAAGGGGLGGPSSPSSSSSHPADTRAMVLAYDYTVMAGTQGFFNHIKKDRMIELAHRWKIPVVLYAEGGGGRPGDTDGFWAAGLAIQTFSKWGQLSGLVPLVGITTGYCFAGNAVLLGSCDVIIATENSNIGIGGPAMIEGGGLGVFPATAIGPSSVHGPNGVIDVTVKDEAEATAVAKQYLSYFQGPKRSWGCADQRRLRDVIPLNRVRVYEVRDVLSTLFDAGSVLELRPSFGLGMLTALGRLEGRAVGVIGNDCKHLSGAIDSDGADKAARMMSLCDAFDLPIVFLCDCPGFMVGPESEKTASVRHMCRMLTTGGALTVPVVTVVTRKAYGLGAQAMAGGSLHQPCATVGWPTSEFGGMGLEGAVTLGFKKELEAEEAENGAAARAAMFDKMVASSYASGKGLNTAVQFEIDDVIDPADTRKWLARVFASVAPAGSDFRSRAHKKHAVDAW
jgi:acetyl-CoA carboxylase carboxyltransferase component